MILRKKGPWSQFTSFIDGHRKLSTGLAIGMVLAGAGFIAAGFWFQPQPSVGAQTATPKNITKEVTSDGQTLYYSPLSGAQVDNEATTKRQVTAIMIENSLDARPQSGIKPAGVIFEAIAEGGITRFLTLHQEGRPALVGPVRSLRPYYIDWLAPFDAAVAHVGGSANALKEIRGGGYKDIDQFFAGNYYWRATDRVAPHNVYTSFDKLDALNASRGYTTSTFTGFPRKMDSPAITKNATKIDVNISSATYNSSYTYDTASNSYVRSEGGKPHTDREAGQLAPKSVIVIKVPVQVGYEDGYREQMTTLGFNEAHIFQDGQHISGFWRKDNKKEQIRFYDQSGVPIALNAGQTWVTVVAPNKGVTWQ
jgi:hypothetical protein